jgi:hypothetical protein
MKKLKLLFEKYGEALKNFGVHPCPFPENEEISNQMDWIEAEFWALLDVISRASDFAAAFSVESILKLLYNFDCVNLVKFRENLLHFPDAGSTSIIHPNGDVQAIKCRFTRVFWFASGKEFEKKIAHAKLDKVGFW